MKTLLTVDFDFFVPEKPEWDFGHRESLLFLNMLWGTRMGYLDLMKTDGNEKDFWQHIPIKPETVWVSDSHMYAYTLLHRVNRVVLFDAHHDCWHSDSLGVEKREHQVYCHNWLREWLIGGKNRKALWVKPEWQDDACTLPDDMKSKVEVVTWHKGLDLGLKGPVVTHICRSGCWVPPWLDKAFLGFVEASTGSLRKAIPMQDGDWNPLKERWTAQDFENQLENEKKVQEIMKTKLISVNSEKFLNCKVEQQVAKA